MLEQAPVAAPESTLDNRVDFAGRRYGKAPERIVRELRVKGGKQARNFGMRPVLEKDRPEERPGDLRIQAVCTAGNRKDRVLDAGERIDEFLRSLEKRRFILYKAPDRSHLPTGPRPPSRLCRGGS